MSGRVSLADLDFVMGPGERASNIFDYDAGIVTVPNTGVYTTLATLQYGSPALLAEIQLRVLDAAAVTLMTWQLVCNGIIRWPFGGQTLQGQITEVVIGLRFNPGELIQLQAQIPTASPVGFDSVGRLRGWFLDTPRGIP